MLADALLVRQNILSLRCDCKMEEPDNFSPESSRDLAFDQPMPHSVEAERAFISGIILDNSLIAEAIDLLKPEAMYVPTHRHIYTAMIALFEINSEINPVTIANQLRTDANFNSQSIHSQLNEITYGQPHVSSLKNYAEIIRGHSIVRKVIKAGDKMRSEGFEGDNDYKTILANAEKAIFDIAVETQAKSFSRMHTLTEQSLQKTYDIQQSGQVVTGVTTGLVDLDALTSGLQKQDLIIIAARPAMGKTALAVQIARYAAVEAGAKVAVFELEMSDSQIAMRTLCAEAKVDSRRYRSAYVNDDEWARLGAAHNTLENANLWVDDTPAVTALQIKSKSMRLIAEQGKLDMIVIDYLGLMDNDTIARNGTREREVAVITKGLKRIAKELDVAMVLLCQLNRSPENRTDHRPKLSDLRESGAIEQDADVVMFIYRGDEYKPKDEPKDNTAEIIVAKQRNGATDTVYLRFDKTYTRFDNLAEAD